MKIETKDGIGEGLPLTDIQMNNKLLKRLLLIILILGSLSLLYIFWLTYYIIKNNVLNNVVAMCS